MSSPTDLRRWLEDSFRAYERTVGRALNSLYDLQREVGRAIAVATEELQQARTQRDAALAALAEEESRRPIGEEA